jgi:hypothetical protein
MALFMARMLARQRCPVKSLARPGCGKEGLGKAAAIA